MTDVVQAALAKKFELRRKLNPDILYSVANSKFVAIFMPFRKPQNAKKSSGLWARNALLYDTYCILHWIKFATTRKTTLLWQVSKHAPDNNFCGHFCTGWKCCQLGPLWFGQKLLQFNVYLTCMPSNRLCWLKQGRHRFFCDRSYHLGPSVSAKGKGFNS